MESFVDVTYHGIEVARRAKLTEVSPEAGYLEVAAPMPVGTPLVLTIDGMTIDAVVRSVHEQVGGAEHPPGMRVRPALAADAAQRWWSERVTLASEAVPPTRPTLEMTAADADAVRAIADRAQTATGAPPFADPARHTRNLESGEIRAALLAAAAEEERLSVPKPADPEPRVTPADGIPSQLGDEDGLIDDGKRTEVMAAVDPEILARLTSSSGEIPIQDDGKRTTLMDIPPVMDDSDSGDDDSDGGNGNGNGASVSDSRPPQAQGKRKRRRR